MAEASERRPQLPAWDDDQSYEDLEQAYEAARKVFVERKDTYADRPKGTIVLVDGSGDLTVGEPGEDLVSISERHYQLYKRSFDGLFEFRVE